uniref:Transmembrane protein n=1 Tax=Sipha flava TaxID=143950 RepID=A0A2S2QB55_9HEMI
MSFQWILHRTPFLRCLSFSRTFSGFNSLHRINRLDQLQCFTRRRFNEQSIFNINTSVPKDVILYKSSSDRTFKMISIFSIVQFGFWLTVADTYNVLLKQKPKDNEASQMISWLDQLKAKGKILTVGIPVACLCMGAMLVGICFVYTMKSVKMLVLCRGGDKLSITSFGFFNRNITTTIPLENISCAVGRNDRGQSIPMKVKGKWFHYILDKNGKFFNPTLFDLTAGMKRNI